MREWRHDEFLESLRNSLAEARLHSCLLHVIIHDQDTDTFIAEKSFYPDDVEVCVEWVMRHVHATNHLLLVRKSFPKPGNGYPFEHVGSTSNPSKLRSR